MKRAIAILALSLLYSCSNQSPVAPAGNDDSIPDHEDISWSIKYSSTIPDSIERYSTAVIRGYHENIYVDKYTTKTLNDPYRLISISWYIQIIDQNQSAVQYKQVTVSGVAAPLGCIVYLSDTSYTIWKECGNQRQIFACADGYTCN